MNMDPKWFGSHLAHTMSKYGMEYDGYKSNPNQLKNHGIASNALWPKTTIATAAIKNLLGGDSIVKVVKPEIMADAAFEILHMDASKVTREFS